MGGGTGTAGGLHSVGWGCWICLLRLLPWVEDEEAAAAAAPVDEVGLLSRVFTARSESNSHLTMVSLMVGSGKVSPTMSRICSKHLASWACSPSVSPSRREDTEECRRPTWCPTRGPSSSLSPPPPLKPPPAPPASSSCTLSSEPVLINRK